MRDIRELRYMQSLPLEEKIEMTRQRIQGWYEHFDGNVYVSFLDCFSDGAITKSFLQNAMTLTIMILRKDNILWLLFLQKRNKIIG